MRDLPVSGLHRLARVGDLDLDPLVPVRVRQPAPRPPRGAGVAQARVPARPGNVIVGTNEEAANLAAFLRDWQASGVRSVGLVATADGGNPGHADLPVLGSVSDIAGIVRQHGIEDVIVAITSASREQLLRLCEDVDALPVQLRLSSGLYEMLTTRVSVRTIGTVPLMSLQKNRLNRKEAAAKALLDKVLAGFGLLLLLLPPAPAGAGAGSLAALAVRLYLLNKTGW